jgi:hypothetical protein
VLDRHHLSLSYLVMNITSLHACVHGNESQTIAWLVDATTAARAALGPSAVITHAPQAPYFGRIGSAQPNPWTLTSGGYSAVYAACGAAIRCRVFSFRLAGGVCVCVCVFVCVCVCVCVCVAYSCEMNEID